ncbi:Protein kinase-like protein [Gracilaria domingensis]|nr:Protein kinase-like protein [Gracilaria domingensis]
MRSSRLYQEGEKFDQYVIIDVLCPSYDNVVYCAYDTVRERKVLLTIDRNKPGCLSVAELKLDTFNQLRESCGVNGLPFVKVLDFGKSERFNFVVQEYHGPLVSELVQNGKKITREKATTICLLILDAIINMHQKGLVMEKMRLEDLMLIENVGNNPPTWSAVHIARVEKVDSVEEDEPEDHQDTLKELLYIYLELWFSTSGRLRVQEYPELVKLAERVPECRQLCIYIYRLVQEDELHMPNYDVVRELFLGRRVDPSLFPPPGEHEERFNVFAGSQNSFCTDLWRCKLSLLGRSVFQFKISDRP